MIRKIKQALKESYVDGMGVMFQRYWHAYGGLKALTTSPYLHLSFLATCLLWPLWTKPGWWETAISVSPSILGFSLAGYAIWLALGDEDFRRLLGESGSQGDISPFMKVNAAFVHFMFMQVLSLLLALFFKAYLGCTSHFGIFSTIFSFFGFLVFVYSILCVLAATFTVLRVSYWYEAWRNSDCQHNE